MEKYKVMKHYFEFRPQLLIANNLSKEVADELAKYLNDHRGNKPSCDFKVHED